ncbi:MAG: DDE-type integrase/transposase/recombinase [Thermocrinis sp.]|nr:DDE-type integrase/transposase/recombinase [Thermocrinis sp.]
MDETKVKLRDRTYYLWLAIDERGLPAFVHLSRRRDSWTAKKDAPLTRDLDT